MAARVIVMAVVVVVMTVAEVSSGRSPLFRHVNHQDASYIGLILETDANEKPLLDSGLFVSSYNTTIHGRIFYVGTLNGVDIVYVKTGGGVLVTASTAQLLVDSFAISGIVHYGTAGSVNDTLFIGDVSVPSLVVDYGIVQWTKYDAKGTLKFGDYNLPEAGENSLGSFKFNPIKVFNASGVAKNIFFIPINSTWFDKATQLEGVELEQCLSTNKCLPREPEIVYGLRAGTADVYMTNAAAREFMYNQFKLSTVDTTTASIAWLAYVYDLPFVAFKGVSNTAGGSTSYKSYSSLGSTNAFKAAAAFIDAVGSTSTRVMRNNAWLS